MMKFSKVIFVFLFAVISILFSQTVLAEADNPDMPEYCMLLLDSDETLPSTTVVVDGVTQIEPKTREEFQEYHIMLPRADNGRGNGTIHYSNSLLPMGGDHEYALVQFWNIDGENQPYDGSDIFPGIIRENGELVFSITELGYGCNLFLCKVLTIEEVKKCNQFLEDDIDFDNLYSKDGFIFVPLIDYGIPETFRLGISAAIESSNVTETNNNMDNGSDISEQHYESGSDNSNEDSSHQGEPPEQPTDEPSG